MIEARGLTVRRGKRLILDEAGVSAPEGKVTAILGANGAGKSTLLRALCGDTRLEAGSVRYQDRPLESWHPAALARIRAVVPQASPLNFPFTVGEVVHQGCAPHRGRPASEDAAAVWAALEEVGLAGAAERDYLTLSGGDRQRVHIARALAQIAPAGHGKCLLLDEPTSSQDIRQQHAVLRILKKFAASGGCAVVVLHDLNLCFQYADKVVLMHWGKVLGAGDASAVLTADWLGMAYGISMRRVEVDGHTAFLCI